MRVFFRSTSKPSSRIAGESSVPVTRHPQSPVAVSSKSVHSPCLVSKRLLWKKCSVPSPLNAFFESASQSRQKSGLTHGLVAMRNWCFRRNALIGDIETKNQKEWTTNAAESAPADKSRVRQGA